MPQKKTSPLRYAVGMFGTSIPINMFKTYAAAFYVMQRGDVTTEQLSLVLLIYTFVDALDNPIYGILSDRTRSRWARPLPPLWKTSTGSTAGNWRKTATIVREVPKGNRPYYPQAIRHRAYARGKRIGAFTR